MKKIIIMESLCLNAKRDFLPEFDMYFHIIVFFATDVTDDDLKIQIENSGKNPSFLHKGTASP